MSEATDNEATENEAEPLDHLGCSVGFTRIAIEDMNLLGQIRTDISYSTREGGCLRIDAKQLNKLLGGIYDRLVRQAMADGKRIVHY